MFRTRISQRYAGLCRSGLVACAAIALSLATMLGAGGPGSVAHAVPETGSLDSINQGLANKGHGDLKNPVQGTIGGEDQSAANDTGVATWVGRNMYVGAPTGSSIYDSSNYIQPSYAVEAEGLTLVNGKLAMNMVKGAYREFQDDVVNKPLPFNDSWHRNGFRFGVVGFGGQVRPASFATVLSVGNNVADNPVTLKDANGNEVSALGFGETGRGFVDAEENYWVDVNGPESKAIGSNETWWPSVDDEDANARIHDSLYGFNPGFTTEDSASRYPQSVNWNYQNTTGLSNIFEKVNYSDDKGQSVSSRNFANFQNATVNKTSDALRNLDNTGTVTVGVAPNGAYTRQKYNYYIKQKTLGAAEGMQGEVKTVSTYDADVNAYQLDLTFNDQYKEKLVTFTGDGISPTQVFTIDGSQLSSDGYQGVSFAFDNIPEGASVAINVVGQVPEFHTGWRLWWNGEDVSNYYVMPGNAMSDDEKAEYERCNALYSKVSEAIMWNFADAENLTIKGGQVSAGQAVWTAPKWGFEWRYRWDDSKEGMYYFYDGTHRYGTGQDNDMQVHVEDDPAAAMLGSIMVPNGTFESHVTTNGRVWVGQDFMMYNPDGLKQYAVPECAYNNGSDKPCTWGSGTWNYEDISASLVCMDQERHNFVWSADYTESAGAIAWNKVNDNNQLLAGTTWEVFNSLDKAKERKDPLLEITDNGAKDYDSRPGVFKTQGLVLNADYYVREKSPAPGYETNPRIYRIDTSQASLSTHIVAVFDSSGQQITNVNDMGLGTVEDTKEEAIANRPLPAVSWTKVDGTDGTVLSGSAWKLTGPGAGDAHDITDVTGVRVYLDPAKAIWPTEGTYRVQYRFADTEEWQSVLMVAADGCEGNLMAEVPSGGRAFALRFIHTDDAGNTTTYQAAQDKPFTVDENTGYVTVTGASRISASAPSCAYDSTLWRDSDPRAGHFTVPSLDNGTYAVQETTAPDGYQLPETNPSYGFTVNIDKIPSVAWNADLPWYGNQAGQVANERKPGSAQWTKVEEGDSSKVLSGSEWSLTYAAHGKSDGKPADIVCAITDTTASCTQGTQTVTPAWATDADKQAGQFVYEQLPWGEYTLVETKAPEGYNLDATPRVFRVGPVSLSTEGKNYKLDRWMLGTDGKISNEPGVVLPATGGTGSRNAMLAAGAVFVMLGLIAGQIVLRKQS